MVIHVRLRGSEINDAERGQQFSFVCMTTLGIAVYNEMGLHFHVYFIYNTSSVKCEMNKESYIALQD